MLTVCYCGNFKPWWSTETHIAATLEDLDHRVIRLQEDTIKAEDVERKVEEHHPDMLLWTRTWAMRGDAMGMVGRLKIPTVAYHLDLYAGLDRAKDVSREAWWKCTHVITADGGSPEFWQAHGINHHWLPPAVYAKECYRAAPLEQFVSDVIFVGSYGYHREWSYRPTLIDNLRKRYGDRFKLYGSSGEVIRGQRLNILYASARVIVGDSCCLGFNHPNYWSDRIPETLGRGGFLIHPEIPGLERDFTYGEHFASYKFNDWDGLYRQIDYYLDHPDERERIVAAGHEHVKAHHTYAHRMREMLRIVGLES